MSERLPYEEWRAYVAHLEQDRQAVLAEKRRREAAALEEVAKYSDDPVLQAEAKAKRAYAEEFARALEAMEKGKK